MKSDSEIKREVEDELRWDPDIDATDIAVAVKNGVVTLAGFVRSYGQRRQAEDDAKRIAGVLGLANDIEVRLPFINQRPDPKSRVMPSQRFRRRCRIHMSTSRWSLRTGGLRSKARSSGNTSA